MKKILFLSGGYYPETTPNGVCLRVVSLQLIKMGYEVHIACQGINEESSDICHEGIFLHYVKPNLFLRLRGYGEAHPKNIAGRLAYFFAMLLNKIQKLVLLPWYPLNHPGSLKNFYKRACELHKEHAFDKVIGLYCPLEATYAAVRFKKDHPEVKVGAYILDSLIFMPGASYFPKKIAKWLQWRMERKVYDGVDMVFNMRCHEVHHKAEKYDVYRNKMKFLDIPLFNPQESLPECSEQMFDKSYIQMVYMGTLFENYREPYYLCRLAADVSKNTLVQIQFYTRGSCETKLAKLVEQNSTLIKQHGYVSHSLVGKIYADADFLVNIGVTSSTNISSKIFDYMAYGKPIIHLYYQDDDVNNKYLAEYPNCCLVQMKEELYEENLKRFTAFIKEKRGVVIDSNFLLEKFKENTPEFTANAFVEF